MTEVMLRLSACLAAAITVTLSASAQPPPAAPKHTRCPGDRDCDGLSDRREDRNRDGIRNPRETSADRWDTDGDGTSDARELAVGTDPNRNGLLSFPEPMVFDLVRGLDSARGELEVNVLTQLTHREGKADLTYAPEVEWAITNGLAVELELPFRGSELEAIKVAGQTTLGLSSGGERGHGLQAIAEIGVHQFDQRYRFLWIGAARLSRRTSVVGLIGAALERPAEIGEFEARGLWNASVFYATSEAVTLGLEFNLALRAGEFEHRMMPQAHIQVNHHFRLQWGLGAEGTGRSLRVAGSARFVVEL